MKDIVMPPEPRIKKQGSKRKGGNPANLAGVVGPGRPNRFQPKWDWAPVVERYVKGYDKTNEATGIVYRYYPTVLELAQEFNMPLKTVQAQCTEKGWVEQRDAWMEEQRKARDAADLKALLASELRIRKKALLGAEKIIDRVAGTEDKASLVDGAIPEDLPALAVSLRRAQEVANVAIGIPKDGVKAPGSDDPGNKGDGPKVTVWAQMRASRQDVLVGVQVSTQ